MWIQVIDHNKVREAVEKSGFKQIEICDSVGIKAPSLCKFMRDGKGLSEEKIVLIAELLGKEVRDWLLSPKPSRLGLSEREARRIEDFLLEKMGL